MIVHTEHILSYSSQWLAFINEKSLLIHVFNHIGATAGPTLITEAPPTYSDVIQQPKHGTYPVQQGTVPVQHGTYPVQQGAYPVQYFQQPGQPQFVYLQQPGARPGAQTMPYVVRFYCYEHAYYVISVDY